MRQALFNGVRVNAVQVAGWTHNNTGPFMCPSCHRPVVLVAGVIYTNTMAHYVGQVRTPKPYFKHKINPCGV